MSTQVSEPRRRRYQQRKRAETQEQTKRAITEATVELHGSIGMARTTISAIAQRAGVTRATVYRHFPDERSLFQACSGMFAEANPIPDPSLWAGESDPSERLRVALDALYAWYERVAHMLVNVLRDAPTMPIVRELGQRQVEYFASVEKDLSRGWGVRGRRAASLRAGVALALDFTTWHSLNERGVRRAEAVELMVRMVAGAV